MKTNYLYIKQKLMEWFSPRASRCASSSRVGFTLVELLVVVAIIGVLSTFAIGGLRSISRASALTTTAQRVADQINLARQIATARNLPVEVRVYSLPYFGMTSGGAWLFRGMQVYVVNGTNYEAASRRVLFPERVIIRDQDLVSVMSRVSWSNPIITTNWGEFGKSGYGYRYFTIRPDGKAVIYNTTDYTNNIALNDYNNWFTLHNWEQDIPCGSSQPMPSNYAIVQINPFDSKATIIRP
jgi:uncharacterized protein (TIGR02596 family)